MTPNIDPGRLSREELDGLMGQLQAEQLRRNDMQDLHTIISEEMDQAKQRILERFTDRQIVVDIFGPAALKSK